MHVQPLDAIKHAVMIASVPVEAEAISFPMLLGLAGLSGRPPAPSPVVDAIATAIDRQEGPGIQRNNPGNIRSWGSAPIVGGFAQFSTEEEGWQALYSQIQKNINRGLTLEEFFGGKTGVYGGYAPSADRNNPTAYAGNVSKWTGIPVGVPLDEVAAAAYKPGMSEKPSATALAVAERAGENSGAVYDTGTMFSVDSTAQMEPEQVAAIGGALVLVLAAFAFYSTRR